MIDAYKVTAEDRAKGVKSAPDVLTGTAQQNKAIFDQFPDGFADKYNLMIDYLTGLNLPNNIKSSDVRFIRINADNAIEVSADGVNFAVTGSSGHLIYDKLGNLMPQRTRMKFTSSNIRDENGVTVIEGLRGEPGIQGIQGTKGDTG
ncbi:MAG: hypothetical protein RR263_05475, partial [Oscillospiraceae bacterium]